MAEIKLLFIFLAYLKMSSSKPVKSNDNFTWTCHSKIYCKTAIIVDSNATWLYEYCNALNITCCEGPSNQFSLIHIQQGQECCPGLGRAYNTASEICVAGEIRARKPYEENCGPEKSYNINSQACCKGINGENTYNVYDEIDGAVCCNEKYLTRPGHRCCSGVEYFTNETTCCLDAPGSEKLFPVPHGRCCTGEPYDPNEFICDAGVKKRGNKTLKDCGTNLRYDDSIFGCCKWRTIFNLETQLCDESHGRIFNKNYVGDDAVCVAQRGSGNGTTYKMSPRVACIDGKVRTLTENQKKCGNHKIYDVNTDLCCTGNFVHINVPPGSKCCDGGSNLYNPITQSCCVNNVGELPEIQSECCNTQVYNPETHECLNNRRLKKKSCVKNNLSLRQQCLLSKSKVGQLKKNFAKKGINVFTFRANSSYDDKNQRLRLDSLEQMKEKRNALKLKIPGTETFYAKASNKCNCLREVEMGEDYVIITAQKFKKNKKNKRAMQIKIEAKNTFVARLNDIEEVGKFFSNILRKS